MKRLSAALLIGNILGFLQCCGALHQSAYYAWLTATPLGPERLQRVQFFFWICFSVMIASGVGSVVCGVLYVRSRRLHEEKPESSRETETHIRVP